MDEHDRAVLAELAKSLRLLESTFAHTMREVLHGGARRLSDCSQTMSLDTSQKGTIRVDQVLPAGAVCTGVQILDHGGGLTITMDSEKVAYAVLKGDAFDDEIHGIINWVGGGAGTATVRLIGVLPR